MALELYFSNDVETLGNEFMEKLMAAWEDPLRPPALLVPNRYIEKWLKLFISRKQGVLVGLYGEFIEKFLWRVLVADKESSNTATLIDGALLSQALLHVMGQIEENSSGGELDALRNYLAAGSPAGRVRRRTGLASRLSGLFLEYEYSRPDLYDTQGVRRFDGILRKWPDHDYFAAKNAEAAAMETWQRALYKKAMHAIRASLGNGYMTLPGALAGQEIAPAKIAARAHANGLDKPVFIFGVSGLSLFHRQVLLGISQAVDVHVFTLNPCSAFWEDVDTTRREMGGRTGKMNSRGPVPGLSFDEPRWKSFTEDDWDDKNIIGMPGPSAFSSFADDNRLLKLWGMAGKENIALWCQAVEYRFNERYVDNFKSTILDQVKRTILYRLNGAHKRCKPETDKNASLIVFDAPGIRREVETMRDYILETMRCDATLCPSDFGIYVTDPGAYQATLHEVLDEYGAGHPLHVPWLMADEKGATSLFCKAVTDILSLATGDFGRSAVFALLRNPLVAAACGADDAMIDAWECWAAACGVSHGMDRHHRALLGEHDPSPQHTWLRAFERLMCAGTSDTDIVFDDAKTDLEETVRPFCDMESSDTGLCANFVRTVEALFRDARSLTEQKTWKQAAGRLAAVIRAWTDFPDDYGDEERVADRYYEELLLLEIRDSLEGGTQYDFEEFKALAQERADFDVPVRSSYLTGKLTVSCIRPSRAVPCRIVYVLGMNEGAFPGNADRDTLDLRTWKHVPGDLRPFRQAQYAFLELLVCAQERLVLSFTGFDLAKDAKLLPCGTVFEVQSFVNDAVLEGGSAFTFTPVALLAEGEVFSPAKKEHGTWALPSYSQDLRRLLSDRPDDAAHSPDVSADACVQRTFVPSPDTDSSLSATVHYSTMQLASFLRNPLEYTLRRSLGLEDDADVATEDDAEPFATNGLTRWQIKDRFAGLACDYLFGTTEGLVPEVKTADELAKQWGTLLRQAYGETIIDGNAPERVFAEFDMLDLAAETRVLADACAKIAEQKHAQGWIYHPAEILQMPKGRIIRPYVEVALAPYRRLCISSPPHRVFVDPRDENNRELLIVCVSGATVKDNEIVKRKHLLEPMLFSVAASAAGFAAGHSVLFVGFTDKNKGALPVPRTFGIGKTGAQTYLATLASAIEDPGRMFDHVPFEILEDLWGSLGKGFSRQNIEDRLRENDENGFGKVYQCGLEACAIAEKNVPEDSVIATLVDERFGLLLGTALRSREAGDDSE
jgi:exonuclease V gamma subunit